MDAFYTSIADIIFSLLLIFLPLMLGLLHVHCKGGEKVESILIYYIFMGIGIQGLASGIMQTFYSSYVIQYVHWPFSPFMLELGLANISFGILGILSPWMTKGWRSATAFGYALFLFFTGMRHALEILHQGSNPGNSGAFAYVDYIMSCILFILLALHYRQELSLKDALHKESQTSMKMIKVLVKSNIKQIQTPSHDE